MSYVSKINSNDSASTEITCNTNIAGMEQILKYAGQPHGMSLIAVSILDQNNVNVHFDIRCDDENMLNNFVDHMMGVWSKYQPIVSFIRSYKVDGQFMDKVDGVSVSNNDAFPTTTEDYAGKDVIIDAAIDGNVYKFKFYRWSEGSCRSITLSLKDQVANNGD